jgi:hypothetical protein
LPADARTLQQKPDNNHSNSSTHDSSNTSLQSPPASPSPKPNRDIIDEDIGTYQLIHLALCLHILIYVLLSLARSLCLSLCVEINCNSKRPKRSGPPEGYTCPDCGVMTTRAQPIKWKRGPNGDFLCSSCLHAATQAAQQAAPPPAPQPKPAKRKPAKEIESWIKCDRCNRWVAACDDNIQDMSVYDDDNPNHLDYFCPTCRESDPAKDSASTRRNRSRGGARSSGSGGGMGVCGDHTVLALQTHLCWCIGWL